MSIAVATPGLPQQVITRRPARHHPVWMKRRWSTILRLFATHGRLGCVGSQRGRGRATDRSLGSWVTRVSENLPNETIASTPAPSIVAATSGLRTPRAAAVAGIAFGVLYVLSTVVLGIRPPEGMGPGDFDNWYRTTASTNLTVVSLYLTPFAGIAFLWFVAVIRSRVGEREDRFFATVFIGSGLLFVAMLWAAGAVVASLVVMNRFAATGVPDPATFDSVRSLAHAFFYVYATRAAAIFVIVTSTIALGTATFPRWLVVLGYVIAVFQFFSVGLLEITILFVPAWVVILSLWILGSEARARAATTSE